MSPRISGYKLARGKSAADLEEAVAEYIRGGWQPYGPMQIDTSVIEDQRGAFYQPMVFIREDNRVSKGL